MHKICKNKKRQYISFSNTGWFYWQIAKPVITILIYFYFMTQCHNNRSFQLCGNPNHPPNLKSTNKISLILNFSSVYERLSFLRILSKYMGSMFQNSLAWNWQPVMIFNFEYSQNRGIYLTRSHIIMRIWFKLLTKIINDCRILIAFNP